MVRLLILVLTTCYIAASLATDIANHTQHTPHSSNSTCFGGLASLDLVLAHYHEGISDVARWVHIWRQSLPRQPCVHLYTKGTISVTQLAAEFEDTHHPNRNDAMRLALIDQYHAINTNRGRESHTFLFHIIYRYHTLADHTIFFQALPHQHHEGWNSHVVSELSHICTSNFTCLSSLMAASCGNDDVMRDMVRMREIFAMANVALCPETIPMCLNGQFQVSRAAILQHPLAFYKMLFMYLEAPSAHWIHKDFKFMLDPGQKDRFSHEVNGVLDDPLFGHVMERMWMSIFRCFPNGTDTFC